MGGMENRGKSRGRSDVAACVMLRRASRRHRTPKIGNLLTPISLTARRVARYLIEERGDLVDGLWDDAWHEWYRMTPLER